MRPARRRNLTFVLLPALFATGCYGWSGKPTPTPESTQQLPDPVRITRNDAATLVLREATVSGDSIVGYTEGSPETRQRVAIALTEVERVQGREVSFVKTAGTSFAITLVVGIIAIGVAVATLLGGMQ